MIDGPATVTLTEILEARDVCVRFGGLVALQNINLAVLRGEIFGLIGPNGAGKSTTVNVLTGFQQPTSGYVLVDGRDIRHWRPYRVARSGVGRTFQAARLFADLTVLENVMVAGQSRPGPARALRERAMTILDWLGCGARAAHSASSLSYADQRRVGIARALALEPWFILLDEPAAGMNAAEADELVDLIAQLPARWGCGVLLIEHNMSVIMRTCERILVLDGGRPIAEGTPAAILDNPEVRRAYLGSTQRPATPALH